MRTTTDKVAEFLAKQRKLEETQMYRGFTVAQLRKAMDAVQNEKHWKNTWAASVPHGAVHCVQVAVEFYHADAAEIVGIEPITGNVLMRGNGYQAD